MARLTNREKQEIVEVFFGINPRTFDVERVSLTRDNLLQHWSSDVMLSHPVLFDRSARAEIIITWGLTDLFSTVVQFEESEDTKRQIAGLTAKAEALKKTRV